MALSDRRILSTALVVGLMAAMSLSACGRKGPLEAPPYAATAVASEATDEAEAAAAAKPDRDFILDPLLR